MRILVNQIADLSAAANLGKGLSIPSALSLSSAGAGYQVGDVLTLDAGAGTIVAGFPTQVQVTSVDALGAITGFAVAELGKQAGVYTAKPNAAQTVTGGAGAGATLTVTAWKDNYPPAWAKSAEVNAETQAVRYRDDGTDPTAAVGNLIPADTVVKVSNRVLRVRRLIAATAGATATVTFYPF